MPLSIPHYVADGLWILAMALIASTSRAALKRVPASVRMPMWGGARLPRNVALGVMFGAPLVVGLGLSAASSLAVQDPQAALLFFLVRITLASVFAVVALTWLRGSLRTLEGEGAVHA